MIVYQTQINVVHMIDMVMMNQKHIRDTINNIMVRVQLKYIEFSNHSKYSGHSSNRMGDLRTCSKDSHFKLQDLGDAIIVIVDHRDIISNIDNIDRNTMNSHIGEQVLGRFACTCSSFISSLVES